MMAAIIWGHTNVVKVLLDCGVDVNSKSECTNWTPLHAATLQENGQLCELLLQHGADPRAEDAYERRPVDYASIAPAVWRHFEENGCERTSKEELVTKSIIKKVVEVPEVHHAELEPMSSADSEKSKANTKPEIPTTKSPAQPTVAEYSRPGSAYVKRDAGAGLPPPPPTRAGRPLVHGQGTRRVREAGRGHAGMA